MNGLLQEIARKQQAQFEAGLLNPNLSKTLDVLNRGTIGGLLGGPVDLVNTGLNAFGLGTEKPIMGSEWIGDQMQNMGMVTENRYPMEETVAGFIDPLSSASAAAKLPLMISHLVYHGSPHTFDAFDASKIGTGEGAQAYGHGLYLAESPDVGRKYVDARGGETGLQANAAWMRELAERGEAPESDAAFWTKSANGYENEKASFYKADIPDEWIPRMLKYDGILSEQPEALQSLAKMWGVEPKGSGDIFGSDILREAEKRFGGNVGAADALSARGIPGLNYLDGSSRGSGDGTYNYVIFPGMENQVKILERNGVTLGLLDK